MKNLSVSTPPPFKKMKKTFFIILVMFTMVSIQNIQAQDDAQLEIALMGILSELHYEDKSDKYYFSVETDKIASWRTNSTSYISKQWMNFVDIDMDVTSVDDNEDGTYTVTLACKDGKNYKTITYSEKGKKVTNEKADVMFFLKFNSKGEADAFMAKLKKAIGN